MTPSTHIATPPPQSSARGLDYIKTANNVWRGFADRKLEAEFVRYNFSQFKLFTKFFWPILLLISLLTPVVWWVYYMQQGLQDAPLYLWAHLIISASTIVGVAVLTSRHLSSNYDIMAAILLPILHIAIINQVLVSPPVVLTYAITHMHLVYIGAVVFLRMRFRWLVFSLLACWTIGQLISLRTGFSHNMLAIMNASVFFGMAILWASYLFERYARYVFLQKKYFVNLQKQVGELEDEVATYRALDPDTRILNTDFLVAKMTQEVALAKNLQHPLWLMTVDVDYFGLFCSNNPSNVVKNCVYQLSDCLKQAVHPVHKLSLIGHCRQPGAFQVMLVQASQDEVTQIAQTILNLIEGLQIPHRQSLAASYVTASIGIAGLEHSTDDIEDLIYKARQAVVQSMQSGRKCYRIFKTNFTLPQLGAQHE